MCLKFRFNAEKCCLWGCFSVFVLVVVFIAGIASLLYFSCRPYLKYQAAMKSGDGKSAVYYATKLFRQQEKSYNQRVEKYGHACSTRYNNCYHYLSCAYELNGGYDIALERYQTMVQQNLEYGPDIARVHYRMGRHSESFKLYCEFYKKQAETVKTNDYHEQEHLYNEIMCHYIISDSRKFRPFATFHDFYAFMKKEHEISGGQGKYSKVMELFRRVDSKADSLMADAERFLSDRHE